MDREAVRTIVRGLAEFASVSAVLNDSSNLYDAGLSSYGAVELMLALETELGIQVPANMLTRETFETISAIINMVEMLYFQQRDTSGHIEPHSDTSNSNAMLFGISVDEFSTNIGPGAPR